jgi:Flp pilus assembly protein TadD
MLSRRWILTAVVGCAISGAAFSFPDAQARDLKITIPKRSNYTPVQRLNREGVEAVNKHKYAKAEQLFYKAYLFDPDDPFTLNNLGYISELQGQLDRAQRFYALAAEQPSDAVVDRASSRRAQGGTLQAAIVGSDSTVQVNHANVEGVRLLSQGRALEADAILQEALKTDPQNVFTLNNMGVAKEMEGEDQEALKYYDQSASARTNATAVVTANRTWRGHPVSEIAADGAKTLRNRLAQANNVTEQVAELNLRGVSAVNRNDLRTAEENFRKAYALNPNSAFTLNNIAYVAELDGDRETAEFFYDRARKTIGANATVAVATRQAAEGKPLFAVAADSNGRVDSQLTQEHAAVRRDHEPPVLRRRDNSIVDESVQPESPADQSQTPQ